MESKGIGKINEMNHTKEQEGKCEHIIQALKLGIIVPEGFTCRVCSPFEQEGRCDVCGNKGILCPSHTKDDVKDPYGKCMRNEHNFYRKDNDEPFKCLRCGSQLVTTPPEAEEEWEVTTPMYTRKGEGDVV